MRLITKTILYYLLVCIPLMAVVAVITLFSIKRAVNENLNETMWADAQRAKLLINSFKEPQNVVISLDSLSSIKIDTTGGKGNGYLNIFKIDAEDGEQIEYRAFRYFYPSKGTNYLITIVKPKLEEDDLIENLLDTLFITIGFLIIAFFVLNWILSRTLWKPFNKTIKELEHFELKKGTSFHFQSTSTSEFKKLNSSLEKMLEKIKRDFIVQKEFTENASHEIQTPLAVIKARIDLLLQSPNLKENEMNQMQAIENAVNKLSSLNRALLLLTKIDNNQFKETEPVDMKEVMEKTLLIYSDSFETKKIALTKTYGSGLKINMNPVLADILVGNLIQNAIRHNFEGGKIEIDVNANGFSILNTGKPLNIGASEIFERFKKNDASKESLGLGLSIVKSIAEVSGLKIKYEFRADNHIFTLSTELL